MDKVLVTIYVVSLDKEFDIFLPVAKKIDDIILLVQDSIVDLSAGAYKKNDSVILYNSEGKIINMNNLVKFSGIQNGAKLIML